VGLFFYAHIYFFTSNPDLNRVKIVFFILYNIGNRISKKENLEENKMCVLKFNGGYTIFTYLKVSIRQRWPIFLFILGVGYAGLQRLTEVVTIKANAP